MRRCLHSKITRLMPMTAVLISAALLLAACACMSEAPEEAAISVLVDGSPWTPDPSQAQSGSDLRVYITYDGDPLLDLPFAEPHLVRVVQPDGDENVIAVTADAVYMESANCENQDCVHMGEVTRDNLEMRVMGGFIICLPHRISVEVR